jgi:glycosyltransferase involved in cell wall biosynthesis
MPGIIPTNSAPESSSASSRLRVLVVAYYFPPMGLSGVQRVSKFVKYLPLFDWYPTVLTVQPGAYYAFDTSLLTEIEGNEDIRVCRTGSADPTKLFPSEKRIRMPSEFRRRVQSWFSQLVFIPDNKKGWKRHAVEEGKKLLEEDDYDVIFASAPPYTALLAGLELSRWSGVPLVSDFRDDWLGNPRHIYPTPWHRRRHHRLEAKVVRQSAAVTTINRYIQDRLVSRHFGARGYNLVSQIPQGFDPEDFSDIPRPRTDGKLRFLYSGVFYDSQQPDTFLLALKSWLDRNPHARGTVEGRFVGLLPDRASTLIEKLDLGDTVEVTGYVAHDRAVQELMQADVLWMIVGRQKGEETIGTGKLFEYFGAQKPVLGLVPDGAAKQALSEYGASEIAPPDDVETVVEAIDRLYRKWREDRLPSPNPDVISRHNRKRLAGDLARLFISLLKTE